MTQSFEKIVWLYFKYVKPSTRLTAKHTPFIVAEALEKSNLVTLRYSPAGNVIQYLPNGELTIEAVERAILGAPRPESIVEEHDVGIWTGRNVVITATIYFILCVIVAFFDIRGSVFPF